MKANAKFTVNDLGNGVWNFNERDAQGNPHVDAYLIYGSKKALLIDTMISECNLLKRIGDITSLPLEVVITHWHMDHAGQEVKNLLQTGIKTYMAPEDCKIYNSIGLKEAGKNKWKDIMFEKIEDGMIFDLGDRKLEIISIPGHTPGCIVILDRENQLLFSGDSIGSGHFWMQVPFSTTLTDFLKELKKLKEKLKGLNRLVIYPGHRQQSPVTLSPEYIDDVYEVTQNIVSGSLVGKTITEPFAEKFPGLKTGKGLITDYCYDPKKIR